MIPAAVVVVTAALTLKSDSGPVKIQINKPRGSVYWGGAGLNGPYINDQVKAFQDAGIQHIWVGKRSNGDIFDALRSGTDLRYEGSSEDGDWLIAGMEKVQSEQFNLIGYSYGSLMAAQTANVYANHGHIIDHLVLIASPVSSGFLDDLRANKNIKKVIVIDLKQYNDEIYAGMPQWRLSLALFTLKKQDEESGSTRGIGHFYYRPNSEEGRQRRRQLAAYLKQQGLK